jgi:hypothetical protein
MRGRKIRYYRLLIGSDLPEFVALERDDLFEVFNQAAEFLGRDAPILLGLWGFDDFDQIITYAVSVPQALPPPRIDLPGGSCSNASNVNALTAPDAFYWGSASPSGGTAIGPLLDPARHTNNQHQFTRKYSRRLLHLMY